jgi:hypothetical protein
LIISFTTRAWYDAVKQVCEGVVMLEDALQPMLGADYGGIAQFSAVLVAMDSDETENARFRKPFDKVGLCPGTDLRYLSVSVGFTPEELLTMTPSQVACTFALRLGERLASRPKRLPHAFDYERFHENASRALDAFVSRGLCTAVTST